jgi:hypothetical protein
MCLGNDLIGSCFCSLHDGISFNKLLAFSRPSSSAGSLLLEPGPRYDLAVRLPAAISLLIRDGNPHLIDQIEDFVLVYDYIMSER